MSYKENKQEPLRLLAAAYFEALEFLSPYNTGSPMLDCKRPFGNSSVDVDVLEIIGVDPEEEEDGNMVYSKDQMNYGRELYVEELVPYLKEKCLPIFKSNKRYG